MILKVESPSSTFALATPTTLESNAANPIDVPLAAIESILLKFKSFCPAVWYAIIASVLIPVTPEKYLPGTAPVFPPLTVNLSAIENLGGSPGYKTASAIKSLCKSVFKVFESCHTDLISSTLWTLTCLMPTLYSSFSLMITCSPTKNVPDVWERLNAAPFGFAARYPVAPLERPLTNEVSGTSEVGYSLPR